MATKIDAITAGPLILDGIGGVENIYEFTHCVTRLRFILKDESLVKEEELNNIPGVVKALSNAGQYQVIIGMQVTEVYDQINAEMERRKNASAKMDESMSGLESQGENRNGKNSIVKRAASMVTDILVGTMVPLLPIMIAAGFIRTIAVVLGPQMTGILGEENEFYRIMTYVGSAAIYFLPVFAAWSGSVYLHINTAIALMCGAYLLYPDFVEAMNGGLHFLGMPVVRADYSGQVVPIILILVCQFWVEKLLKKIIPEMAQMMVLPILEVLIMLPIMMCWVGPLGTIFGNGIAAVTIWLHAVLGPVSVALIGAFFIFICATGMHHAIILTAFTLIGTQGFDDSAMVGAAPAAYACFAIYLVYMLMEKDKKNREIGLMAFTTHAIGGIAEPGMFSIMLLNRSLLGIQIIAAFFGSLYIGIQKAAMYSPGIGNMMAVVQLSGGSRENFVHGTIGCGISFAVGLVLTVIYEMRKKTR